MAVPGAKFISESGQSFNRTTHSSNDSPKNVRRLSWIREVFFVEIQRIPSSLYKPSDVIDIVVPDSIVIQYMLADGLQKLFGGSNCQGGIRLNILFDASLVNRNDFH